MKSREIVSYIGGPTGATINSYEWRSQPTRGPFTGKPIRAIVVRDEYGRCWGGIRFGASATENARTEFWGKHFNFKSDAIDEARHSAREALCAEAQIYTQKMLPRAQPGEEIVRVTMDDGWSYSINAPGSLSPAKRRVMALFQGIGKGKETKTEAPAKRPGRDWPSR
jgi:hypothetical protein